MQVEDSEQHSRVVELADEAVEQVIDLFGFYLTFFYSIVIFYSLKLHQLKQVDAAFDLHALGFASRYLAAIHTSCVHLAQRSAQALSVLEQYSSSHFEDEVDQVSISPILVLQNEWLTHCSMRLILAVPSLRLVMCFPHHGLTITWPREPTLLVYPFMKPVRGKFLSCSKESVYTWIFSNLLLRYKEGSPGSYWLFMV